jgi:hypothetical protein
VKKILLICLLYSPAVFVYADACPDSSTVVSQFDAGIKPIAPSGWEFIPGQTEYTNTTQMLFSIAAYGADLHIPTSADKHVRCYYYPANHSQGVQVAIQTQAIVSEDKINGHSNWSDSDTGDYHLCTDYNTNNVHSCEFG